MSNLLRDVRFGWRMLWKDPGFTALAVLTLALGIGANTAIFSLGNVFMFRPLPVKDAGRLTVVAVQNKADGEPNQISYLDFLDYREHSGVFTDITGYVINLVGLGSQGHADRLVASYVPSNFFSMLGLRPAAGRLIMPGEGDAPGTGPVVVLGHSYWKKRFAGDPSIIGHSVSVDGQAVTVVGVVPQEFHGLYNIVEMDAYLPIGMLRAGSHPEFFTSRDDREVRVVGTLKPGVGVKQAQAALQVIADRLAQAYPEADKGQIVRVYPERIARPEPSAAKSMPLVVTVFLVMVGLVLLVACINDDINSNRGSTAYMRPDIMIRKTENGYEVELIEEKRYHFRVSQGYNTQPLSHQIDQNGEEMQRYVNHQADRARFFIDCIRRRWRTLKRVAELVVEYQAEFLSRGVRYLRPLTRAEVATRLNLDEGTVSRATANKYALLPNGRLMAISDFFDGSLGVKDILRELIAAEEPRHHLSDDELARILTARGIPMARRTITKYREEMGIPSSRER